ncbi:MAG: transposase [Phycisphaerae bacterium]|nr:transposase [Phycisphaerae bacterium]
MPRVARVVIPGCPHHVTQRGNNRQDVFFVDDDRRVYLDVLRVQCQRFGLAIDAYCLMTNHVHLVATPGDADALARAVGRTHWRYTQYVNEVHGRSGHLWQNRFYSCPLDDEHFWTAVAYVERNPARAKVVRTAWQYPWSSAAAHVIGSDATGLLDLAAWAERLPPDGDWRDALQQDGDDADKLRRATVTGRPLASDRFISKLETRLGRRLRTRPRGRPK